MSDRWDTLRTLKDDEPVNKIIQESQTTSFNKKYKTCMGFIGAFISTTLMIYVIICVGSLLLEVMNPEETLYADVSLFADIRKDASFQSDSPPEQYAYLIDILTDESPDFAAFSKSEKLKFVKEEIMPQVINHETLFAEIREDRDFQSLSIPMQIEYLNKEVLPLIPDFASLSEPLKAKYTRTEVLPHVINPDIKKPASIWLFLSNPGMLSKWIISAYTLPSVIGLAVLLIAGLGITSIYLIVRSLNRSFNLLSYVANKLRRIRLPEMKFIKLKSFGIYILLIGLFSIGFIMSLFNFAEFNFDYYSTGKHYLPGNLLGLFIAGVSFWSFIAMIRERKNTK